MHWWQGAFASSKSHSVDDSDVRFSLTKPTSFFSMRRTRHIQRARKLQHVSETDVVKSTVTPQPLPLPELQVLLRRDSKFAGNSTPSLPLPSPTDEAVDIRSGGSGDKNVIDGVYGHKSQDTRTNAESKSSRKSPVKRNTKTTSSDNVSIPSSAPSTPFSSFTLSPPRHDFMATPYMTPPGVFQVWSAPEMPHSDRNLGVGFYNQFPCERSSHSVDNSPLQSPRKSVNMPATSLPMPTSPLNAKVHWETHTQAAVHPLPLPPVAAMSLQPAPISSVVSDFSGASMPELSTPNSSHVAKSEYQVANATSQSAPISPVTSKPEVMPIKSKWQKGKLIGRGTFGSVYVASNRETGALCAMKEVEILPDDSKSAECMRQLEQEIKVLSRLKHPNIVQYYGSEIVGEKFHIYLEYVHPGSINRFIQDHCGAITESVVRNFTRHILCGLAYLHSKKTIHRDIKGANLLVDAYGVVKLADFGMAKHLTGQAADLSLKGSPYWLAPELLQSSMQKDSSSDVALAVDIWSLGCTIIEMMNGKPPWSEYEGAAALFKVLQETPPIPETMSADGKDFLQCCFRRNPADRPTASTLLNHPFLNCSQQPDACTQSLKEMKLSENTHFLRERPNNKMGKPGNDETSQQKNHQQISRQIAQAIIPSPRPTLTLSVNGFGNHPDSSYVTAKYQKGF